MFNDQTGQRKPADNLASLSTAITQGAGTWLVQALKNAGKGEWFTVVERMQLDNLLKERQIIRNTRSTYEGDKAQAVPPMLFAGVLVAGGVVGYDTNTETGGMGARYLGIGIQDEYRRDMVSISLRLISVQTGEVLIAVSSQKTILSTKIGMNVFKFIDMGTKLVEVEGGSAKNESTTYAVRKAIEQAVVLMIEEGINKKLWAYKK
jgi:curli production assembly/transport component CsgG